MFIKLLPFCNIGSNFKMLILNILTSELWKLLEFTCQKPHSGNNKNVHNTLILWNHFRQNSLNFVIDKSSLLYLILSKRCILFSDPDVVLLICVSIWRPRLFFKNNNIFFQKWWNALIRVLINWPISVQRSQCFYW